MTIAIGVLCREAILLSADTEYTGSIKTHASKIHSFSYPGGKVAVALAGNSAYAWSAVMRLEEKLSKTNDPQMAIRIAERVLAQEYRRQVFSHPDRKTDWSIPYWLLLGFWSDTRGLELYYTSETVMNPEDGFECIGSGRDIAHVFLKPCMGHRPEPREAWHLCSYAVKAAKQYAEGCGGDTLQLVLTADGRIGQSISVLRGEPFQIDKSFLYFQYLSTHLLLTMANPKLNEPDFQANLQLFNKHVTELRLEWSKEWTEWKERFRGVNPKLADGAADIAYLETSMGLVPPNLPLRASSPATPHHPESTTDDQPPPQSSESSAETDGS